MKHWKRSLTRLKQNKIFSLLGLAARSRNVVSGEFSTEKAVKEGKAKLVLVAEDASDNTKKLFSNKCSYYRVPIYFVGRKDVLGHAMGKESRASLAITDPGFAKAMMEQL